MISIFFMIVQTYLKLFKNDNIEYQNNWIKLSNKLRLKKSHEKLVENMKLSYWKQQYKESTNEMMTIIWKKKYNKVIRHVNSNLNYFYWKKNNSLIDYLNDFNLIVINLESFYNYVNKKLYHSYYLNNIIKYCNYNKIPVFLIGELHPNQISKNFLHILKSLSLSIYISPYHYNKSKKLKNNMFNDQSDYLNVNKIIKDLIKENKVKKSEICYLGNDLTNYNSFQLCFD